MILHNVTEDPIHGSSYVFEILTDPPVFSDSQTSRVWEHEKNAGMYKKETYQNYKYAALNYKNPFHNTLLGYKLAGKRIIGYGSTAKSNTLLNFCRIKDDVIDWIIDENELKQNLFTPGFNIPIRSIQYLETIDLEKTVVVIFVWDFFQEIKEKIIQLLKKEYQK